MQDGNSFDLIHAQMLDAVGEAVIVTDLDGKIQFWNRAAEKLYQWQANEVIGKSIHKVTSSMATRQQTQECMQVIGQGDTWQGVFETQRKDESRFNAHVRNSPIHNKTDRLIGITRIYQEFSKTDALRESEEKFHLALEASNDGVWDWDILSNRVNYSPGWAKILGEDQVPQEFNTWEARIHPEDKADVLKSVNDHMKGLTQSWQREHRLQSQDGSWKWVLGRGRIMARDGDDQPLRMVGTITDISDRKLAEFSLRQSEEKFKNIINNTPMGIHIYRLDPDENLVFTDSNPAADTILGVDCSQFVGQTIEEAFPPLVDTEIPERYRRAAAHGESWQTEEVQYDHGEISGAFEVFAFQTSPGIMTAMFMDITERKVSEEALREFNELLSLFIKNSPVYAYIKEVSSTESRTLYSSENFIDLVGIPSSQMVGKTMDELFPPEFAAKITADDWEVVSKGEVLEIEEELNDRSYNTFKFPIHLGSRILLAGYTIDITERKIAQEELIFQAKIVGQVSDAIIATNNDDDYSVVYWNKAAEQIYGYAAEEVIGKPSQFLNTQFQDQDREQMIDLITEGGHFEGEVTQVNNEGTHFPVEVRMASLRDDNDQITGWIATNRDITNRKDSEIALKESQQNLVRSQRIAQIGSYEWNLINNQISWSEEMYNIFGVEPETYTPTDEGFKEFLHPDDLEFVSPEQLEKATAGQHHELEFRISPRNSEEIKTIHIWGETTFDEDGNPIHISAALQDITIQKSAEDKLIQRMAEIERINEMYVGREVQMVKLKQEINNLLRDLGRPAKYSAPVHAEKIRRE